MAFTFESIVRLFANSKAIVSLKESERLADELLSMHSERVCTVENVAFANGKSVGKDIGKLEGYDKGYAAGKMDSEEYNRGYNDGVNNKFNNDELIRLTKIEDKMINLAEIAAKKIAEENPNGKLRAIRLLMDASGLPVAECKKIMENVYNY